jgi:hypothetical protein
MRVYCWERKMMLDQTLLIYHETKSLIYCYIYLIIIVVYLFRQTIREIDVGTKRLLPRYLTLFVKGWLLEWWWSNRKVRLYSSIVSKLRFYYSDNVEIFRRPTQCYDVHHGLARHMTMLLVTRTPITWIE